MNEARAVATMAIFALSAVGGIGLYALVDRGPGENPYPSLSKTDEPAVAREVVAAIAEDDARSLSKLLSAELLQDLDAALQPVMQVRNTKFVGAVESEGRLLSAYVASGKTESGTDFIVGFVLRVANDQVVGVN